MTRPIELKNEGDPFTADELNTLVDATLRYKNYSVSGTVFDHTGVSVWYPPLDIDIPKIEAWVSSAPSSDITVSVKKNDVVFSTVTIGASQVTATADTTGYSAQSVDRITIDVSGSSGTNLNVRLSYH